MKYLSIALVVLSLTACGKEESKSSGIASSKGLMSQWIRTDGIILDMSNASFGANVLQHQTQTGYCQFSALIAGSDDAGSVNVGSSTYHGSGSDPGCASLNGVYAYTKGVASLSICKSNGDPCMQYK